MRTRSPHALNVTSIALYTEESLFKALREKEFLFVRCKLYPYILAVKSGDNAFTQRLVRHMVANLV